MDNLIIYKNGEMKLRKIKLILNFFAVTWMIFLFRAIPDIIAVDVTANP